jgi:hypothetical protein
VVTGNLTVSGSFVPTGVVSAPVGTAALPGLTFTGDLNTGISAAVADTLVLSTAGVARGTFSAASIALAATAIGLTGSITLTGAVAATAALTVGTTLGVTGTSTLAALGATNGTFSGTLGVTGTSTLAAVNATNGTFSGTLGVTGVATFTAQPIRASAGAFLYNASSSNSTGTITVSNSVPGSAAAVGSPGSMRFVYA